MATFLKKDIKDLQIGLDVGTFSVKSIAVSHAGPKPQLLSFSIKDIGDNVVSAIKDAHAELGFTRTRVVVSISGPAVIVRYVELPAMSDEDLQEATRFEAEKVIPYDIGEVELDSIKMEGLEGNRMRAIIVAAKKDLIDSQLKLVSEAGLEATAIDIDSFAIMNAFTEAGIDKENVCGLLNIGSKKSNLNIIKGDKSYLSRDIDMGDEQISEIIAESKSIPKGEALKFKKEKMDKFAELSEEDKKAIQGPVADVLSKLSDEVRLSFDFYENHYAGNVAKVYISGGTVKPGLFDSMLKEALGRDVSKWDPFAGMDISEKIDTARLKIVKPQLAVAAGLALRRPE